MRVTANIIKDAVRNKDGRVCAAIAETLRFEYGFDYAKTYLYVSKATGISEADWDELLQEGET